MTKITFPAIILGIVFVVLILGAVMGNRFGKCAGWITGVSFVLLLVPFLTFPFGNTLLRVAQLSSGSTDLRLFFKSVSMATTASVIAVVIAFPVAYYLAFCVEKTKYTWLLIVITPFLTSYLLRIFAWKVVLGDQGLINSGLMSLGVIDTAAQLPDLQPVHGDDRAHVRVGAVHLPADLHLAREHGPQAARGCHRPRRQPHEGVREDHAAAGCARHRGGLPVRVHPVDRRVHHAVARGWHPGYMFGQAVADHFIGGAFDWQGGSVLALFLLTVVLFLTAATSKFLRAGGGAA